jgi:predicted nucleic acid-binding protein
LKFWDASAIVPLLLAEPATAAMQAVAGRDRRMLVWWATEVECASAIARLERDGALEEAAVTEAFDRLKQLSGGWYEVDPTDTVREAAVRFLRVHPLRTADALQLAAAFIAAERRPSSLELVTLDDRLAGAARKEGFVLTETPSSEDEH